MNELSQAMPTVELTKKLVGPATDGVTYLPTVTAKMDLKLSTENGGLFAWQNPFDVPVLAAVTIEITSGPTAESTVDAGVAANATTSSDTLIDGGELGADDNDNVLSSFAGQGANGLPFRRVDEIGGANDWITGTAASTVAGMEGSVYVHYIPTK